MQNFLSQLIKYLFKITSGMPQRVKTPKHLPTMK